MEVQTFVHYTSTLISLQQTHIATEGTGHVISITALIFVVSYVILNKTRKCK